MNSIARPVYFSAYPLKAYLGNKAKSESPYLSGIFQGAKKSKAMIRLFPMVNPYLPAYRITPLERSMVPDDIELIDRAWFNHYE